MTRFLLLTAALWSFAYYSNASEQKRIAYGFMRIESAKDPKLTKQESQFQFTLYRIEHVDRNKEITYSIDGDERKVKLSDASFTVKTTPGRHIFQIYISPDYYELYSDSLEIWGGYTDKYNVYVEQATIEVISDKPVIYLYPEKKEQVNIELAVEGEVTFTYPAYNNGWNVVAHPDGTIESNGRSFNYLFWEGKQEIFTKDIDFSEGFITSKDDIIDFVQQKLNEAGFTSQERADFITYWVPRMLSYDLLFIQFVQNEDCNRFATLDITPKPTSISRFYMIWTPIDEGFKLNEQIIQPIIRDGFTVLEWGGQQLKK